MMNLIDEVICSRNKKKGKLRLLDP